MYIAKIKPQRKVFIYDPKTKKYIGGFCVDKIKPLDSITITTNKVRLFSTVTTFQTRKCFFLYLNNRLIAKCFVKSVRKATAHIAINCQDGLRCLIQGAGVKSCITV